MHSVSSRQLTLAAFVACTLGTASVSQAGPLTDWLFGQYRQPPAYPVGQPYYAAGTAAAPNGVPVLNGNVANYPTPYVTNYPSNSYPTTLPAPGYAAPNVLTNPSPYVTNYPAPYATTAPLPTNLPLNNPYASTLNNSYSPNTYSATPYNSTPYSANYGAPAYSSALPQGGLMPQGGLVPQGGLAPSVANQPINMTGPIPYTGIPQSQVGLLPPAGYATQYNRAAVTNYRPVTSLDPSTGTTITQMVPCTSYELQAQRIPMLSLRPALFGNFPTANRWPSLTAPVVGNSPNYYSAPAYNTNPVPSNTLQTTVNMVPVGGMNFVAPGPAYSSLPSTYPNAVPYPVSAGYVPYPTTMASPSTVPSNYVPSYGPTVGAVYNSYPSTLATPSPVGSSSPVWNPSGLNPMAPTSTEGVWQRVEPSSVPTTAPNNPLPAELDKANGGLADPESTVKPFLPSQSRAVPSFESDSRFGLKAIDVTRSEVPMPAPAPSTQPATKSVEDTTQSQASLPSHAAPAIPDTLPRSPNLFESLQPIPAPADAPAPRWNPGLMDQRDRTALQNSPSASQPTLPERVNRDQSIRWISTEVDRPKDVKANVIQQPKPSSRVRPSTAKAN